LHGHGNLGRGEVKTVNSGARYVETPLTHPLEVRFSRNSVDKLPT
jgi:hypothetical protein